MLDCNLSSLFVDKGLITRDELSKLQQGQENEKSLNRLLVEENKVSEAEMLSLWSKELGLETMTGIPDKEIQPDLIKNIPIHFLKKHLFFPLRVKNKRLRLALADPLCTFGQDQLCFLLGCRETEPVLAPGEEIVSAINRAYGQVSNGAETIIQDLADEDENLLSEIEEHSSGDLLDETSNAPVIKLVNHILSQSVQFRASDIHIEPYQQDLKVRYRMDGVLYDIMSLPKRIHPAVSSRIKILANLDIAEKRKPQDGRIRIRIGNREIDLRVSSLPTVFGERIVMRILEKDLRVLNLNEIGMSPENLKLFKGFIRISHGIILVTGPTGSGKTTTLYSALTEINTADKNILTIEDPVEYQVDGIGQMQVNSKIDLTFANGLRSMVRQDPDVILVGEIRDLETAEIAIQAALTGHLVFSTLHTNDAAGAITRIIDMGIEPFLVSSAIQAILAQRLVRTLCPKCRESFSPSQAALGEIGLEVSDAPFLYKNVGCEHCLNTGYKGRKGIFEFLEMTDSIRSLALKSSESNQIREAAAKEGMRTLRQDSLRKICAGQTTMDEVLRVTQQ